MPIVKELIVDELGVSINKQSERLIVSKKGVKLQQVPIMHLDSVVIASPGVSVTSSAIAACCEKGIPIHFLSTLGEPVGALYSAGLSGTVMTRRSQLNAYQDRRALTLAVGMAIGKVRNQAGLLRYAARNRKESAPEAADQLNQIAADVERHTLELDRVLTGELPAPEDEAPQFPIDAARGLILSAEGRAAKYYWDGVGTMLSEDLQWPGRRGRGAQDVVNSCLNYGYGVLYGQIERAIVLAGLDPYAGFLHADRPGKPAMTLDLIEEFRPLAVDRTVLAIFNRKQPMVQDEERMLDQVSRRTLAEAVLKRLAAATQYGELRVTLSSVIQSQARQAAAYLRGERPSYDAYIMKW